MNLHRMAVRIGGLAHADDLVQHAQLVHLRNPNCNFRNVMLNRMEYERHREMLSLDAPISDGRTFADITPDRSPDHLTRLIQRETVQNAVRKLSPRRQEFIQLHFYAGFDSPEIAKQWNVSRAYVDLLKHRTLAKLSALMTSVQ